MKSKIYQTPRLSFCFMALCAGILLLISSATVTAKKAGKSPLMPPHANFRGMSFEDWNVLAVEIDVATAWGVEEGLPNTYKRTLLLRNGLWLPENEFDVQISPGTALVLPVFFIVGERYADLTEDGPNDLLPDGTPLLEFFLENTVVELKLDGEVILGGTAAELEEYQFGATYFEEPVAYEDPQPRGPNYPDAIASIFTFGVGAVFHPLPPGEYTIESSYVIDAPDIFGDIIVAHFTFNVTVGR